MNLSDNFSILSPEAPNLVEASANVFGTSDDPVDFTYGGTSDLPDGSINPEDFAAFPKELYDQGLISPGTPVTVFNPATKKKVVVIARHAKTDDSTGIDLAPHSLLELGPSPNKKYVLDLKPVKGYPVATYPAPQSQMQSGAQGAGENSGDLSQVSLGDLPDEEGGSPGMGGTTDPVSGSGPASHDEIKSRNEDGSVTFSDGMTIYPDGHYEHPVNHGKDVAVWEPGATKPTFRKAGASNDDPDAELYKKAKGKGWSASDYDMTTPEGRAKGKKAAQVLLGNFPPNVDAGDAALANETPSMRARIQAIVEGRTPPPPLSRNNPINNHIWDLVYAKDPNYSPQAFANYKNFTTGKDADSLTAMDAALEHLANFKDSIAKLDPGKYKLFNKLGNLLKSNTDDPDLKRIQTDAVALEAQLAGFYKGQGRAATDPEMEAWHKIFDEANGPRGMNMAVDETLRLMQGQYSSIRNKFLRTTGQNDTNFQFINPRTQKLLKDKFGMDGFSGESSSADGAASSPTQAAKPGSVFKDKTGRSFRLKDGGDPNKREDYILIP